MNSGDELQFTQMWVPVQSAVASYLAALVRDTHAVDDLLQEVAIVALRRMGDYDPQRPFIAWALGIARLKALEWRRGHRSDRALQLHDERALSALAASAERLAPELGDRELALHACLGEVRGRPRDLLRLHYEQGYTPGEIAERLGLAGGHVRVLLNRARAALRQCVERRLSLRGPA